MLDKEINGITISFRNYLNGISLECFIAGFPYKNVAVYLFKNSKSEEIIFSGFLVDYVSHCRIVLGYIFLINV